MEQTVEVPNICTHCNKVIDDNKLNLIDRIKGTVTCEDCIFGDEE